MSYGKELLSTMGGGGVKKKERNFITAKKGKTGFVSRVREFYFIAVDVQLTFIIQANLMRPHSKQLCFALFIRFYT